MDIQLAPLIDKLRAHFGGESRAGLLILGMYLVVILVVGTFDWRAGLAVAITLAAGGLIVLKTPDRYRQTFENSPNAIFTINRDGRIVTWNHAFTRIFQYGPEIKGQHYHQLFSTPDDVARISHMVADVFDHGATFSNIDLSYQTRSQTTTAMISRIFPLAGGSGRVYECIFANTEVTERQRMAVALRESEERFRQVVENIQEVFYIIDPVADRLVYASPSFEAMWGRPAAELNDKPIRFLETVHPDDVEAILNMLRQHQDHEIEFRLVLPEQKIRWIRMRNTYLRDSEEQVNRIVGIAENITARKQADAYALERERMRILADFIRDASHEFRTPLSIINTKLYLVERMDNPERARQLISDVNAQIAQIDRLLESLVLMARLDSGMAYDRREIDLNRMLAVLSSSQQSLAEERGLVLVLDLFPALPLMVGDHEMLEYAFQHLLDNSLRYTPRGGKIIVRTATNGASTVWVDIIDNGVGIEPSILPHIFERFHRSDTAHSTRGFGLGLPIAQKIVEGHGGHIEVESAPGKGSRFRVVLPLTNGDMLTR